MSPQEAHFVTLQIKGNGRLKKERLWAYVRGGSGPPLTVYDFSHDRSNQQLLYFLSGVIRGKPF